MGPSTSAAIARHCSRSNPCAPPVLPVSPLSPRTLVLQRALGAGLSRRRQGRFGGTARGGVGPQDACRLLPAAAPAAARPGRYHRHRRHVGKPRVSPMQLCRCSGLQLCRALRLHAHTSVRRIPSGPHLINSVPESGRECVLLRRYRLLRVVRAPLPGTRALCCCVST